MPVPSMGRPTCRRWPTARASCSELSSHLAAAWASFDHPRPVEPEIDPALVEQLTTALPESPGDRRRRSGTPCTCSRPASRPRGRCSSPTSVRAGSRSACSAPPSPAAYDANLATAAGAADLLDRQALRWVAEFVGFPLAEGNFTSGGQTSNLTALLAAREHALPGAREHGVAGHRAAVYCSDEAHHSIVRAVEAAGLGPPLAAADADRRAAPDAGGRARRGAGSATARTGSRRSRSWRRRGRR